MEQEKNENEQKDLSLEQGDAPEVNNQELKEIPDAKKNQSINKNTIKTALYLILAFGGWGLYLRTVTISIFQPDYPIIWAAIPAYYIIKNHKGGFDKIGWIHAIFLGLSVPIICFLALIAYIPLAFAYGYSLYALMQAGFIIFIGIIIVQKIRKNKTRL